jgi:hypothetical protein
MTFPDRASYDRFIERQKEQEKGLLNDGWRN